MLSNNLVPLDPYWIDLLTYLAISIIVALGVQVTMTSGQLQSAGAAFMGIAGYGAGYAAVALGLPLPVSAFVGIAVAATAAVILGAPIVRLNSWFFALATLGLGQVLVIILNNADAVGGASGYSNLPIATTLPVAVLVLLVVVVVLVWFQNSPLAQAFRAVAEDPLAAAAMGIPVLRTRLVSFVFGSAICGVGGVLYVFYAGYIRPSTLDFLHSLNFLVYVALGGQGTWLGPIFGATVLVTVPELLRFSSTYRFMIYGLLLMTITILRPRGFLIRKPIGSSLREAVVDDVLRSPLAVVLHWMKIGRETRAETLVDGAVAGQ